jgi:TnpA family transposase
MRSEIKSLSTGEQAEQGNHQHRHAFAEHWGEGKTASPDGQRFRAGGRGEATGQVNLRYGNEPGVLFYTGSLHQKEKIVG